MGTDKTTKHTPIETLLKMLRHKAHVTKNFGRVIAVLQEREAMHDASKYLLDEFDGFTTLDSEEVFALYQKDQAEYRRRIADNPGIKLHYERNAHHPEHFDSESKQFDFTGYAIGPIDLMGFFDLLEMVIDWKSACDTYGTDFADSLEKSIERFKPNQRTEHVIRFIAADLYGTKKVPFV